MLKDDKKKKDDNAGNLKLTGTTLRVYRYLYRMGKPCGIREIQRGLGLSSSSVAVYHVRKLLEAGLIREESAADAADGSQVDSSRGSSGYVVDRIIYENMIRVRRSLIPLQVGYSVFFATALVILLVLLRPNPISGGFIFALLVIAAACGLFAYEALKSLSKNAV